MYINPCRDPGFSPFVVVEEWYVKVVVIEFENKEQRNKLHLEQDFERKARRS